MKRLTLLAFIAFCTFTSCTKKYTNDTYATYTTVVDSSAPTSFIVDSSFPITINFSKDQIISVPNCTGFSNITIQMSDSAIGTTVTVVSYINHGASINLTYDKEATYVSLLSGNF